MASRSAGPRSGAISIRSPRSRGQRDGRHQVGEEVGAQPAGRRTGRPGGAGRAARGAGSGPPSRAAGRPPRTGRRKAAAGRLRVPCAAGSPPIREDRRPSRRRGFRPATAGPSRQGAASAPASGRCPRPSAWAAPPPTPARTSPSLGAHDQQEVLLPDPAADVVALLVAAEEQAGFLRAEGDQPRIRAGQSFLGWRATLEQLPQAGRLGLLPRPRRAVQLDPESQVERERVRLQEHRNQPAGVPP